MAGVEDEDELRDADDAAATDPPPSSPSASTPSKPKPPAAAAGGLGKRLLAFSATFSAAIGRPSAPSSPKPSSPPAANVGLGLLLDLGPKPSADGSDASAHDLHLPPAATLQPQDGEEEAWEEQGAAAQRAQLALRHEEDQVVGHDVGGVGEELALLVPMEEEDQLIAEGGEKEGVVDGCSVNRNGLSLQDQEKEGEQHTRDELGAAMEDQEVVEKEGATKYYTVVEDQSNDAEEQCTGDAPRAIKDDFTVEDQEVVVQEGATKYCTAVEDQSNDAVEQRTGDAPRTVKDDNTVEDQEVVVQEGATKYCTTVEDQSNNAAEQCTGDAPREVKDDITVEDQEVVVQEGATKYCTAVEDQSNNAAEQRTGDAPRAVKDDITVEDHNNNTVEQCASDTPRAINDDIVLEEKENAMEQEGPVGIVDAAEYGIDVGSREEDVLVEGQDEDGISVQDQHKVMEQCTNDELGVAMGESGVQDQEVMVVEQEGVTKYYDAAVEDQSNNTAVEQCTSDELRAVKDGKVVEEKEEEVEQEGDIVILCAAKDGVAVGSQEQQEEGAVVVADQGEDAISLQNQDKVVEQCTSDQLRPTTDDNSVQDHEVVEKEGAIVERGTTTDVIAVETQEKALEQFAGDESRATKDENAMEDKEKMVDQGVLDKQDAIKDGSAVGSQENEDVVRADQGEGGISVQDQDKVVEQRTSDQMRTTTCDNAADKYKAVEQEGTIVERCAAADGIAVESQEKAVEQSAGDESRATKDENTVENKEKVVDQEGVIEKQDAFNDGSALGSQDKEDVVIAEQGEGGISVQDQDNSVEQYNLDQLRTATYNNAVEDYKVVEQESAIVERGATTDGIAIEVHEKAVLQSAGDELRATNDENAVEHKEKVVNLVIIDKQGAIKDGGAVDSQEAEEDVMVAEQGEDGISVQDQDKVVEQCTSDQLRTATGDIDAEDQVVSREKVRLIAGYPQRPGRPNCRFYMSNGGCSYGLSCYYHHPQLKAKPEVPSFPSEQGNREVAEFLELNRVGLPIREGARNCTYFMRNGTCRYGKKCCFNHPEKVLDVQLHMPTGWDDTNLPSSLHLKKSSEHANINDLSSSSEFLPPNILRMLLPPQNVPPATEEKEMKVKKDPDWSSASDDSDGGCSADGSGGPLCKQEHVGYSERPGRQECPFLLRFGNCKFATSCQYYHPKDKFQSRCRPKDKFPSRYHPKDSSLPEERMVYPDKPGEPECPFYMKTGSCKFGAECKFHHPKDLPPSMQAPAIPKRSIAASEHHPTTKTTLQDQMYQQQKYPERPGEPTCRYYMQFGKCKFLSACVFNHPKERLQSEWRPTGPAHSDKSETWQPTNTFGSEDQCQQEQNISGMPECPFYMRTGTCQFGSACQFHHPKHRCSSTEGVIVDGFENAITSQRMF